MIPDLLIKIIAFVCIISVLVTVHELGHYLIARLCGVRVLVFSIGFGPELFGWNDGDAVGHISYQLLNNTDQGDKRISPNHQIF